MGSELVTRQSDADRDKVSLSWGVSIFVLVILGLIFATIELREWLADEQKMPIQRIVFSGNINAIDTGELEQKIRREFQQSFFTVDVNQVHDMLENQPWIYTASIRKRWPNSLYIHVVEQTPVAIWNSDLLLNKYGETFDGIRQAKELPSLYGPNGSEKTALVGYNQMRTLLKLSGQSVSEVFLSERFAWKVRLNNDIVLSLGRQEYIDRLQRYIDAYPSIMAQQRQVSYVDLRYDTGLAVGWTDNDDES